MTETDRKPIVIRAARLEDAEALAVIRALPGVRRGTMALPFPSAEAGRKWHETFPKDDLHLVAERAGGVVGSAALNRYPGRRAHCGGLGIMVHDDHHGQGVGTALFAALTDTADRWLGLLRLELTVFADNAPAIALYRRFGFVVEGRLRCYAFRDGCHADALAMARLAGALAERSVP